MAETTTAPAHHAARTTATCLRLARGTAIGMVGWAVILHLVARVPVPPVIVIAPVFAGFAPFLEGERRRLVLELVEVADPLLEQAGQVVAAVLEQGQGIVGFNVLGEDEHRRCGMVASNLSCGAYPLIGSAWRHVDVGHHHVRLVLVHRRQQLVLRFERGRQLVAGVVEQEPDALANEETGLGQHNRHRHEATIPGGNRRRGTHRCTARARWRRVAAEFRWDTLAA